VGKIVSWIVLIALVVVGLKFVAILKRKLAAAQRARPREAEPRAPVGELMRRCDRCGVHAPASEMLAARGRYYCCAEHRDADR
jgi:hypothetical protein